MNNDLEQDFVDCKKALEFYEKLHDKEFLEKFEFAFTEIKGQNYFDENQIEYHIKDWIELDHSRVIKAEQKFKLILEEMKRMQLTIFYLVDSIRDSSTHYEKRQFTETTLHILRKQINFVSEMRKDDYYLQSFFNKQFGNEYEITNAITYNSLKHDLKKKENKIKELESKLRKFEDE